jgi:hypothetical protein
MFPEYSPTSTRGGTLSLEEMEQRNKDHPKGGGDKARDCTKERDSTKGRVAKGGGEGGGGEGEKRKRERVGKASGMNSNNGNSNKHAKGR